MQAWHKTLSWTQKNNTHDPALAPLGTDEDIKKQEELASGLETQEKEGSNWESLKNWMGLKIWEQDGGKEAERAGNDQDSLLLWARQLSYPLFIDTPLSIIFIDIDNQFIDTVLTVILPPDLISALRELSEASICSR